LGGAVSPIIRSRFNLSSHDSPSSPPAVGYSILYMVFGGGLLGAVVIFIIAKIFRK